MKISILNIDWARKHSSKTHIETIAKELTATASDIIIITESVQSLQLPEFKYVYQTKVIPENIEYEELDYSAYLKNEKAVRVAIYSKYEAVKTYAVTDEYTSVCKSFETAIGLLTIYATIIGTQFNKNPYAQNELANCVTDCTNISKLTDTLCLAGDLNTSFKEGEEAYQIKGIKSKQVLQELCTTCNFSLTTKDIIQNIDHIFLPKHLAEQYKNIQCYPFIAKGILSDHQGVSVEINTL